MKEEATAIQLKKLLIKELKRIRKYPRESYNEIISDLIKTTKESGMRR